MAFLRKVLVNAFKFSSLLICILIYISNCSPLGRVHRLSSTSQKVITQGHKIFQDVDLAIEGAYTIDEVAHHVSPYLRIPLIPDLHVWSNYDSLTHHVECQIRKRLKDTVWVVFQ